MSEILPTWTIKEGIELCREIEKYCPKYGCHVALTGGLLYKDGPRKDCDILFYRIRQIESIDIDGMFTELEESIGFAYVSGFGWCQKATWRGKNIDCFFPEGEGDETQYTPEQLAGKLEIKKELAAVREEDSFPQMLPHSFSTRDQFSREDEF